jgi:N-acetylglucosaminyldiphosphoundecaprenol N-acetyl-beta-D-mannosaminyltransferase
VPLSRISHVQRQLLPIKSTEILGCRVDGYDLDSATQALLTDIDEFRGGRKATPSLVITLGTEMVVRAQQDSAFRELITRAHYSLCDTIGILLASRLSKAPLPGRVPGVALLEKLCASLSKNNGAIFLLGAKDDTAECAAQELVKKYPGLRIAGVRNGYFTDDDSETVAALIRASQADVLFVGLGSPRQEIWLDRYLGLTGCAIGVGVGGSFDVISRRMARAPHILQALGLEWLYRLIREPHRWRRQLALPYFVYLVVKDSLAATLPRRSLRR